MAEFLFAPTPNLGASAFIAGKPAVSRAVFDRLLPELKARAFTITGIQAADVLQSVRDEIAKLPAGGDWKEIKETIRGKISPYFVDEDAEGEDKARQEAAAERRAELLLRTHGQQAYAAAQFGMLNEQRELFPYWQYMTLGDTHVRPTHAALDNVVLPADHEFWQTHYPPWQWGCRCQIVPISRHDALTMQQQDSTKPPDNQRVLGEYAQTDLTVSRRLVRNGVSYNMTTEREEGKPGAYSFHPSDLRITPEQLKARYAPDIFHTFEQWARKHPLPGMIADHGGPASVWDWMSGLSKGAEGPVPPPIVIRAPGPRNPGAPPAPGPRPGPAAPLAPWRPRPISPDELAKQIAVMGGPAQPAVSGPTPGAEQLPATPELLAYRKKLDEIRAREAQELDEHEARVSIYRREHPEGNNSPEIAAWSLQQRKAIAARAAAQVKAVPFPPAPAPIAAAPSKPKPIGPPISGAAQTQLVSHKLYPAITGALKNIDATHGDGALTPIPIDHNPLTKGADGGYAHGPVSAVKIGVLQNLTPGSAKLTLTHEVGHWLDHIGIPSATTFASADPASPLAPVMAALAQTQSIQNLKAAKATKYIGYLLNPHEQFARAYAQFIAEESQDAEMIARLKDVRLGGTNFLPDSQWKTTDFEPVKTAMTAAFKALGWMK